MKPIMKSLDDPTVRLIGGGLLVALLGIVVVSSLGSNPSPVPPVCTENWTCSDWSACANSVQSRACTDTHACGTIQFQPALMRACTDPQPSFTCGDFICQTEYGESCGLCPNDCGACPDEYASNNTHVAVSLGPEETAFDYEEEACADLDLPDVQAHAFRDAQGKIVLVSGNAPDNYWSFGPDFDHLTRSCTAVYKSPDKWSVADFSPQQWITSAYTEDGTHVYGLVHNEYHDPYSTNCKPGDTTPSNPCWYNFVSLVQSVNGGKTFTQPAPPSNVVAMLPIPWSPTIESERGTTIRPSPHGYLSPTNIVKGNDGYYYSMVQAFLAPTGTPRTGVCVMRTLNLEDASSWKMWNGTSYSIPLTNPYLTEVGDPTPYECARVSPQTIGGLSGSLTYNTYLEKYLLVGADVFPNANGKLTCGFWLSLSGDLIHWGNPQLIKETVLGWAPCDKPNAYQLSHNIHQEAYPSLIDHDSPDASFTTTDNTAYLYFMENMDNFSPNGWGFRRNLARVPITFTKEN